MRTALLWTLDPASVFVGFVFALFLFAAVILVYVKLRTERDAMFDLDPREVTDVESTTKGMNQ